MRHMSFKKPSLLQRLFVPLQSSGNLEAPTRIRRQGDSEAKVQGDAKIASRMESLNEINLALFDDCPVKVK
jgi:hypothetical protein